MMLSVAVLLYLCSTAITTNEAGTSEWRAQRDDPADYLVDRAVRAASRISCVSLASERHQAVSFSGDEGICQLLTCRLGRNGCRKCRHAVNPGLPLLWVRQLDGLGPGRCWRTFQHRVDASINFYRNWADYVSEFGQGEDRNFWMGLEAIHLLTRAGDRRVRWEMSSWNGSWWWWENVVFAVQGADQDYRVSVGAQDVDRSNVIQCPMNSWLFMNNQKFSAPDRDMDSYSKDNCASMYHGGWWYSACHCFNPNGRYFTPPTALSLTGSNWATGIVFSRYYPAPDPSPLDYTYSMRTFECLLSDQL